jgi:hypothetical protein
MGETLKFRMSQDLRFWVEVEVSREASRHPDLSKQKLIAEILHEWEEAGEAMRYLRADGTIGWKPTRRMLDWLADAERDAKDDAEDDLP